MNINKLVPNKALRFRILDYFWWIPDLPWLKLLFRIKNGYWMNFKNPKTFNEKLQWLKIYGFRPEYTQMVDKYAVKEYVAKKIGVEYVIPTLGVWDRPEDIEWGKLPNQFVLKTTTGGGNFGVWICKNKNTFDKEKMLRELREREPFGWGRASKHSGAFREHPYDGVTKRIIAEKYIEQSNGDLCDYKFYCFNGMAYKVMVCYDRASGDTKFYSFDRDWNLLRHNKRGLLAPKNFSLPKPDNMSEMFSIAEKLSKDIPFMRVDLYNVDGRIYFGELTLYPASGFDGNILKETDILYGEMIKLPIANA